MQSSIIDDFLSALYSFPGGYLSDKLGVKKALLVFNAISMVGYLIVILIPTWWAVLLGAAFFISWSAISLPAMMDLISTVVPKNKMNFNGIKRPGEIEPLVAYLMVAGAP